MEAAIIKYGPADRRLRIEHSQIMTEDDLARAVRLGGGCSTDRVRDKLLTGYLCYLRSHCELPAYACHIRRECATATVASE
jgi:hypothetical protein